MPRTIRRLSPAALAAPALACLIACLPACGGASPGAHHPAPPSQPATTSQSPTTSPPSADSDTSWRDYVPERCRDAEEQPQPTPDCRTRRVVTTSTSIEILDAISFVGNTADLAPASYRTLDHVAQTLNANPGILAIEVRGHSDSLLHPTERAEIARHRAEVVAAYLVAHGVAPSRVTTYGASDAERIFPPDDPRNRRVELLIVARDE